MLGSLVAATQTNNPPAGLFIGLVIVWLVLLGAGIGALVFTIVCVVDMARRPDWQWKLASQDKVLWIVLVVVVNVFAIVSFIYWFSVRRKLMAVDDAAKAGHYGAGVMTATGWVPGVPITSTGVPPGWFPDPGDPGGLRYWDGFRWTEHTQAGHA